MVRGFHLGNAQGLGDLVCDKGHEGSRRQGGVTEFCSYVQEANSHHEVQGGVTALYGILNGTSVQKVQLVILIHQFLFVLKI